MQLKIKPDIDKSAYIFNSSDIWFFLNYFFMQSIIMKLDSLLPIKFSHNNETQTIKH